MRIKLNDDWLEVNNDSTLEDIAGDYQLFVRNGYGIEKTSKLQDGDKIFALKKGKYLSEELSEEMLFARNGEFVSSRLQNACVCICGLGGLGSNIASMLARLGIGKLILVDFDIVDPTNINRQNYFISDIGSLKTEATAKILRAINPYIKLEIKNELVTEGNAVDIVGEADIVVEAFDNPQYKAELVNTILSNTNKYVVASSGMAGYGSANDIKTIRPMNRLYVSGDNLSEATEGMSLMSPRVNICAGHQANMVLRILLNKLNI